MSDDIASIPNLGPATAAGFARAGITGAAQLRSLGADEAYRRWLAAGEPAHFIGYYALVMGLMGRPWNDCQGDEKMTLRKKFDTLKAAHCKAPKGFEAAMNEIGIRL